jgi:hypothetical protein
MQTIESDDPVEAVEEFIGSIVDNGLRTFMYRVQDLDKDPTGSDLRYVQNRAAFTIWEAADMYGVDLSEGDEFEDDEDDDEDVEEFIAPVIDEEDDDSVVNIPSD